MKSPGIMPQDTTNPNTAEPAKLAPDRVAFGRPSECRFYQVAYLSEREAVFAKLAARQGLRLERHKDNDVMAAYRLVPVDGVRTQTTEPEFKLSFEDVETILMNGNLVS